MGETEERAESMAIEAKRDQDMAEGAYAQQEYERAESEAIEAKRDQDMDIGAHEVKRYERSKPFFERMFNRLDKIHLSPEQRKIVEEEYEKRKKEINDKYNEAIKTRTTTENSSNQRAGHRAGLRNLNQNIGRARNSTTRIAPSGLFTSGILGGKSNKLQLNAPLPKFGGSFSNDLNFMKAPKGKQSTGFTLSNELNFLGQGKSPLKQIGKSPISRELNFINPMKKGNNPLDAELGFALPKKGTSMLDKLFTPIKKKRGRTGGFF